VATITLCTYSEQVKEFRLREFYKDRRLGLPCDGKNT
jgi:hypothetical protein